MVDGPWIDSHTPTVVRELIHFALHHWIYNKEFGDVDQYFPNASADNKEAFRAQSVIGWNHLLEDDLVINGKLLLGNIYKKAPIRQN